MLIELSKTERDIICNMIDAKLLVLKDLLGYLDTEEIIDNNDKKFYIKELQILNYLKDKLTSNV